MIQVSFIVVVQNDIARESIFLADFQPSIVDENLFHRIHIYNARSSRGECQPVAIVQWADISPLHYLGKLLRDAGGPVPLKACYVGILDIRNSFSFRGFQSDRHVPSHGTDHFMNSHEH
jgi:hypothetical protein